MNKTVRQSIASAVIACMMGLALLLGYAFPAWAASGKIQFSDPTATVGSEVTVNLKVASSGGESLSRADITVSYDADALEFISGNSVDGGSGTLRAQGTPDSSSPSIIVFTLKFQAKQSGSSQISVVTQEVYDADSQLVDMTHVGSSTVTVQAEANASSDATLSSLQVAPGTLSPAFSPDVESYSVNVGVDVERLTVTAQTTDSGASYTVSGNEGLQMGENTVVCAVTAQDGTVKNYTITVQKDENGAAADSVDDSQTTEVTGETVSLEAAAKAITIIPMEEGVVLPEGFLETTIDIDGHKVTGWVWESEPNPQYCVFYGMNAAGEKNFYRYDLTEKTIQRYFQDPAVDTGVSTEQYSEVVTQYNDLLHDFQIQRIILIVLVAVALVLFALMLYLLLKGGKGNPPRGGGRSRKEYDPYEGLEDEEEEDDFANPEERYLRGQEDDFDDFEEILLEPQVRQPQRRQEPARPDQPQRRQAEDLSQTQVISRRPVQESNAGRSPQRETQPARQVPVSGQQAVPQRPAARPAAQQQVQEPERPQQQAPARGQAPVRPQHQVQEPVRSQQADRPVNIRQAAPSQASGHSAQPGMAGRASAPGTGAAGRPMARPARPAQAPQRPVNPVPPAASEIEDDDFEFLDIDE